MTVKLSEETVPETKTMRSVKRAETEQRRKLNREYLKAEFFCSMKKFLSLIVYCVNETLATRSMKPSKLESKRRYYI
jgi:hypothetical protein